jgi:hypothetical protein
MVDSRRCPRCYSPSHTTTRSCNLYETRATPPMMATVPGNDYMRIDGTALNTLRFPWCVRCELWGHRREQCVRCGLCNRWGHATVDCESGLLPSRMVPKRGGGGGEQRR